MSTDALISALSRQIEDLSRKVDYLVSEKELNTDPSYVVAMHAAKKGDVSLLQKYAKRKREKLKGN